MFYVFFDSSQPQEINLFLTVVNKKVMVLLFNRWGIVVWSCLNFFPVKKEGGRWKKKGYFFSCLTFLFLVPVFVYVLWFICAFFLVWLWKFQCLTEEMLGQIISSVTWGEKKEMYWLCWYKAGCLLKEPSTNQQKFILFSLLICKLTCLVMRPHS